MVRDSVGAALLLVRFLSLDAVYSEPRLRRTTSPSAVVRSLPDIVHDICVWPTSRCKLHTHHAFQTSSQKVICNCPSTIADIELLHECSGY